MKSKDVLPEDASPLMEPQPPPPWADAKLREKFSAGQAGLSSRSLIVAGQRHTRTVDESMFMAAPVDPAEGASRSSNLTELSSPTSMSDLDLSESGPGRQPRESSEQLGAVPVNDEATATLEAAQSTARQNWELIRKLFTIRQFSPPKAGSLSELLSQPRRREITLNPNFQVIVAHPKTVSLLIVQLLGDEAPVPCDCCAQGRGPFKECVTVSEEVAAEIQNGVISCANCAYKGRHQGKCNLKELLLHHASLAAAAGDSRRDRHGFHDTVASVRKASIVGGTTNPSGEESLLSSTARKKARDDNGQYGSSLRKGSCLCPNLATRTRTSRLTPSQDFEVGLDGLDTSEASSTQEAGVETVSILQSTKPDDRFDFHVITIPTETVLQLQTEHSHFRLCSLVTGKVMVQLKGEPAFKMGAGGVLKLLQGVSGEIINSFSINAVLHVSSIQS